MPTNENVRGCNAGKSGCPRHRIQPRDIWLEYGLNPWDADIVRRVLRTGEGGDRRLDYEKIIHACRERIRQLEAGRTGAAEGDGGAEPGYKTVICPSEKDRPELLYRDGTPSAGAYKVYGVFRSDGGPYAYLGCRGTTHVYLDLGRSGAWSYFTHDRLPERAFGLWSALKDEDHAVSMEIGAYGTAYGKHDHIIARGSLYRYMGATPKRHVYMRFGDGGKFTKVVTEHKIFNQGMQYVKGNDK